MIRIKFEGECPYCDEIFEQTCFAVSEIQGDFVLLCRNCKKRFLVSWLLFVDAKTSSISDVYPPVRITGELQKVGEGEIIYGEDEDEDEGIEA